MAAPQLLYKYQEYSAQSLENLKNQTIYFGSPSKFNDPYDCALFPSIADPLDQDIERLRRHYLALPDLPEPARQQFQRSTVAELRSMFLRQGQGALDSAVKKFLSEKGVSCFSERRDSLLMWSHYAGNHKGFCLEFRTDAEPFQKILPVRYTTQMPAFNLLPLLCDNNFDQVMDLFCTKSSDWQYEREWRALHREAGTSYTYTSEALTGVYFGAEASFSTIEIVALILAGQNEHVKFWRGFRSKSDFSLNFESVTYTTHLDAKRRGLL